jgi:uncharacterized protein YjbI with pentapeptide repeats
LSKCQFSTKYYNYEIHQRVDFNCDEEESLASGFSIFHDKDYLLQDKTNYEEHKTKVLDRLKHKVNDAISNNEPLLCIGFQLPDFNLSDLSISKEFTKPVYFSGSHFFGKADFSGAKFQAGVSVTRTNFQGEAYFARDIFQVGSSFARAIFQARVTFTRANFQGEAYFTKAKFQGEASFFEAIFLGGADFSNSEFHGKTYFSAHFNGETKFNYVLFEAKEKIYFDIEDLSNVSFMNTDITGVRFSDNTRWGGEG